jgi:putative methyltransferase (TIGR04325 family)
MEFSIFSVKGFIRSLIPPIFWEIAHQIKILIKPPPPPVIPLAEIRFASWPDACAASSNYESDDLVRFRVARFVLNAKQDLLPEPASRPMHLLTKIIGEDLRITDFGGSFGEYGTGLCRKFPGITYTVVESAAMVAQAPPLERVTMTDTLPASCDIFFSSGTFQYLDDPYAAIEAGFKSAAKAVVLSRNCFSEAEMFRVQQAPLFDNGVGDVPEGFEDRPVTYPLRTISESKVSDIAARTGFELWSRIPDPSTFPDPSAYSAQLVYLRKP